MIFILSLVVGVLIFDYLVWTRTYYDIHYINPFAFNCACADLLALMDTALSSPSCVLPDAVCKVMLALGRHVTYLGCVMVDLQAIGTPLFRSLLIRFAPLLSLVSPGGPRQPEILHSTYAYATSSCSGGLQTQTRRDSRCIPGRAHWHGKGILVQCCQWCLPYTRCNLSISSVMPAVVGVFFQLVRC
jgi:hypothetical protein